MECALFTGIGVRLFLPHPVDCTNKLTSTSACRSKESKFRLHCFQPLWQAALCNRIKHQITEESVLQWVQLKSQCINIHWWRRWSNGRPQDDSQRTVCHSPPTFVNAPSDPPTFPFHARTFCTYTHKTLRASVYESGKGQGSSTGTISKQLPTGGKGERRCDINLRAYQ